MQTQDEELAEETAWWEAWTAHIITEARQETAQVVELTKALRRLRLEAIHYRDTGVGVEFLNKALANATGVLMNTEAIQ